MERKCYCSQILGREKIYVHLSGCPLDSYSEEWKNYNWWQKLWSRSPESLYNEHLKV